MNGPFHETLLPVRDYDLAGTLTSGQAFRWRPHPRLGQAALQASIEEWHGVIDGRWVSLAPEPEGVRARTLVPPGDGRWLRHYLQTELDLSAVLATFPDDPPMRQSVAACRGLRLLRQDPWECLVSFICSSTKQIVQIQQIIELLCARHGREIPGLSPTGAGPARAFPEPEEVARLEEAALRDCKMGFRAPYVLAAAKAVAGGRLDLEAIRRLDTPAARAALMELPGVGEKIANCVLLFAYGFPDAFPVDVWVRRALQELYFPRRRPSPARLERFAATHFGPQAGYAQQYLFHYMRTRRPAR